MKKYTERQREKDTNIVNFVENNHLNFNNPYFDIREKKLFLKQGMRYKNLKITGGEYAPIEECSLVRVNAVVRDAYRNAKRRLKEDKKKGIEKKVQGWLF